MFTLRFTARAQIGIRGVLGTEYRVSVSGPPMPGCVATAGNTINHATIGERLTIAFAAPHLGWCAGEYRGVIYLERGPHCTKGPAGAQTRACPEFASQLIVAGRFSWQVR